MSSDKLWHLQIGKDKLLYLFRNGKRLIYEDPTSDATAGKEIGGIVNAKPHPDARKPNIVVVSFVSDSARHMFKSNVATTSIIFSFILV